jgi:hypothetical protein
MTWKHPGTDHPWKHLRQWVTDNHCFGRIDALVEAITIIFLDRVGTRPRSAVSLGLLHTFAVLLRSQLKAELSFNASLERDETVISHLLILVGCSSHSIL